jgi:GT2 family glycosyltransferase
VAVVIPNWNSLGYLRRCLDSLPAAAGGLEIELVVVDNGSTDGSVEFLDLEGVAHLALPRNLGFAAAVNLGARRTRSDAVLVLNADTVLEPGALAPLLDALEGDPSLGGVQPLILQLEDPVGAEPRVYSAGQSLTRDGRGFEQGAGAPRAAAVGPVEPFGVCGAACMLRRALFEDLGGYDESFVSFCEDVDLNVRARIAGLRFELVPESVVWHVGNAVWQEGFAEPGAENARLVARNRLATQIKFMPLRAIPLIVAVELGALAKSALRGRLRATAAGKLEALRRLPELRRERRRLAASGDLAAPRAWLGRRPSPQAPLR